MNMREMKEYFENSQGTGILSTADGEGNVDTAIYSRPHVMDDDTVTLIMRERLSFKNLQSNPRAAYMFIEKGEGYKGIRLYLSKVREETDLELINSVRRRDGHSFSDKEKKYLVYFRIDRTRELTEK